MLDRQKIIHIFQKLHESPEAKEAAIIEENRRSLSDPDVQQFVKSFHMEVDRDASLRGFLASDYTHRIVSAVERLCKGNKNLTICEIGAGDGFLAVALVRAGFTNIDILEPSFNHITGTGFLRGLEEAKRITIYNNLDAWYNLPKRYDVLITNACIHHFHNPLFVLSQIRLKAHLKTRFFAFGEFFADDYADTISQLLNHRHAMLYSLYEFPYSSRLYKEMFCSSGFKPVEIEPPIPYGQMILPSKVWQKPFVRKMDQIAWKVLRKLRLTWLVYNIFLFITSHLKRQNIRIMDPFCMVYEAKPVQWANVRPNPLFFKGNALGSKL